MGLVVLALLGLGVQGVPEPAPTEVRTVSVSVTNEKGQPVSGLVPDEVAVLEDGVAREATSLEADTRPLTAVVLVDTSQAMGASFRLSLVDAVTTFLRKLPPSSRYALWTTGDRPVKLVDYTDDAGAATQPLHRVFVQGGNTLLDAILESTKDLKAKEAERNAVVVVTGLGIDFSSVEYHRCADQGLKNAALYLAVELQEDSDFDARLRIGYVLSELTSKTGGLYERTLSATGVSQALAKVASFLSSQYRLSYITPADSKPKKIAVTVARPGVRVIVNGGGVQR